MASHSYQNGLPLCPDHKSILNHEWAPPDPSSGVRQDTLLAISEQLELWASKTRTQPLDLISQTSQSGHIADTMFDAYIDGDLFDSTPQEDAPPPDSDSDSDLTELPDEYIS